MKRKSSKKSDKSEPKGHELLLPKDITIYHPRSITSLDKIRAHMLEQKKLSPKLEYLKRVYIFTNSLLLEGYSRTQTVAFLESTLPEISKGHAYEIVRNTVDLFGDVHKHTKEGLKYLAIENQWNTYRRCVELDDVQEQNKAIKNIGFLGDLGRGQDIDWSKVILPIPVFTTDPRVLKESQSPETIDIDSEEA